MRLLLLGDASKWLRAHRRDAGYPFDLELLDTVPHASIPAMLIRSDMLLLYCPEKLRLALPAKMFEYLRSGVPIFAVVPPGSELAGVLERTGGGVIVQSEDVGQIAGALERCYQSWEAGASLHDPVEPEICNYDVRQLTQRLASLFDEVSSGVKKAGITAGAP